MSANLDPCRWPRYEEVRPVGSYTDEARDHEGKLMAARKDSRHRTSRKTGRSTDPLGFADLLSDEALRNLREPWKSIAAKQGIVPTSDDADLSRAAKRIADACSLFACSHHARAGTTYRDCAEVPARLQAFALDTIGLLALLIGANELPREFLARAEEIAGQLESRNRKPLLKWQWGLLSAFETFVEQRIGNEAFRYPVVTKADVNAVCTVLEEVRRHVGDEDLPAALDDGPKRMVENMPRFRRAAKELRAMNIAPSGVRPGGRAGRITPFAAAQRFAYALGLPFPERERDLVRETKTGRRVSERTNSASKSGVSRSKSTHASSRNARGSRSAR